ncbi:MAG: PHP domain-containing protein, partial [Verrucomicrobiales bacterium]|nr:PHP domain-containing protein [Verrucomicrobiales bacterium]
MTGGGTGDGVADLHVHSSCSDGTFSPAELPRLARQLGLRALALADHDTIDGCEVFAEACAGWGIEFIPATELTTEHNGVEVHILAYYVELQNQVLHAALKRAQAARRARVRQIVARLNRLGIPLTVEAVLGSGKCSSPGRPHVAHALVQSGLCQTYHDAFERYLGKNKPAWVPYPKISSAEAIVLIHSVGGLAVAAHPGLSNAESALPHLIAAGLDGIECYHPKHTNAQTARYLRMAASHGLLVTGGSDCHG